MDLAEGPLDSAMATCHCPEGFNARARLPESPATLPLSSTELEVTHGPVFVASSPPPPSSGGDSPTHQNPLHWGLSALVWVLSSPVLGGESEGTRLPSIFLSLSARRQGCCLRIASSLEHAKGLQNVC